MVAVNADYINPFLIGATKVLKDMMAVETKIGKPYLNNNSVDNDSLLIMLGVTGEMKGQVTLCFPQGVALDIASKMCMMPMMALDELAQSAICELCNMILGNTATVFSTKGIAIDITPPTMCQGMGKISAADAANICIPLVYEENKTIEINVSMKG